MAVYVENQSAYKAGRPQFNAMLARLEKGEAEGILTYHLTRLARNSYDGGRLIYMMDEGAGPARSGRPRRPTSTPPTTSS